MIVTTIHRCNHRPIGEYVQFICRRQWIERNPPQIHDHIINAHSDALKRITFRYTHRTTDVIH
jgi:hypothetical protein